MAQSDYLLDGQKGGGGLRLDILEAVTALVTNNQGASEPSPTYPSMLWPDETNGVLKIRSTDNSRWWVVGSLNSEGLGLGSSVGSFLISANEEEQNYEKCQGQAISRSTFAELFAKIGVRYGIGNGSTTFNLPDARDRALVFQNGASGVGTLRNIGDVFGASEVTLTAANNGPHTHSYARRSTGAQTGTPNALVADNNGAGYTASDSGVILSSGNGTPFSIIQKSLCIGHLYIKVRS